MAIRRIRQLGDPVLREICHPIYPEEAAEVLRDLADTLHEFQRTNGFGRGIAAPQIGEPVRAIYLEVDGLSYSLINPRYLSQSEERMSLWDDCFSFPDLVVKLERHRQVDVEYTDKDGKLHILQASDGLAELLQHEIDHLDGILATDRALDRDSFRTREEHLRQLRNLPPQSG
jgi:peptide deformylase